VFFTSLREIAVTTTAMGLFKGGKKMGPLVLDVA